MMNRDKKKNYEIHFNLREQMDLIREPLIQQNALQIDFLNNIYIASQQKIYITNFKRLIRKLDWIEMLFHLDEIFQLQKPQIIDPVSQAFNLEKKDRESQIEFIQYAVKENSIPIIHSNLISSRIQTLNNCQDLIGIKSFILHPFIKGLIAIILNNGEGYLYHLFNKKLVFLNKELIKYQAKQNSQFQQINTIQFTEACHIIQKNCIMTLISNSWVYFFLSPELILLEQIELGGIIAHEQLIVKTKQINQKIIHVDCLILLVGGKIIFIKLTLSNWKVIECKVKSSEVYGCLGLYWSTQDQFIFQQRNIIFTCFPEQLDQIKFYNSFIKLVPMSKLAATFIYQNHIEVITQEGLIINPYKNLDDTQVQEIYYVNGASNSKTNILKVIAGQTSKFEQKTGNIIIISKNISPSKALLLLIDYVDSNILPLNESTYIAKNPINSDDFQFAILNSSEENEIIQLAAQMYDPSLPRSKNKEERYDKQNLSQRLSNYQSHKVELILQLTLLILWSKKQQALYNFVYRKRQVSFLSAVEESISVFLNQGFQLGKNTLIRIQTMRQAIIEKIININLLIKEEGIYKTDQYKFFNSPEKIKNHIDSLNRNLFEEGIFSNKCPFCHEDLLGNQILCSNGHKIQRCQLTQEILIHQRLMQCANCEFLMGEFSGIPDLLLLYQKGVCPICFGELQYYLKQLI